MIYKFVEILDSLDKLTEDEAIALIASREGVDFVQKAIDSFIQEGCDEGSGRNVATTLCGVLYVDALLASLRFLHKTDGSLKDGLEMLRGSSKEMLMFFYALGKIDEREREKKEVSKPMTLKEKLLFLWRGNERA